jgi:hypothetical protein
LRTSSGDVRATSRIEVLTPTARAPTLQLTTSCVLVVMFCGVTTAHPREFVVSRVSPSGSVSVIVGLPTADGPVFRAVSV